MTCSPEGYYETELKGKTSAEIADKIRNLKKEIRHLKKKKESPDYYYLKHVMPDETVRLWVTRQYLDRAIAAYEEAGGTYELSEAEKKSLEFNNSIPEISKLTFNIGGHFQGYETYTVTFEENLLKLSTHRTMHYYSLPNVADDPDERMTKKEFLDKLRDIHIGEWKQHYNNNLVCDGTEWELTIEYTDGHKLVYDGSNAYPFSFDELCELIGAPKC